MNPIQPSPIHGAPDPESQDRAGLLTTSEARGGAPAFSKSLPPQPAVTPYLSQPKTTKHLHAGGARHLPDDVLPGLALHARTARTSAGLLVARTSCARLPPYLPLPAGCAAEYGDTPMRYRAVSDVCTAGPACVPMDGARSARMPIAPRGGAIAGRVGRRWIDSLGKPL